MIKSREKTKKKTEFFAKHWKWISFYLTISLRHTSACKKKKNPAHWLQTWPLAAPHHWLLPQIWWTEDKIRKAAELKHHRWRKGCSYSIHEASEYLHVYRLLALQTQVAAVIKSSRIWSVLLYPSNLRQTLITTSLFSYAMLCIVRQT